MILIYTLNNSFIIFTTFFTTTRRDCMDKLKKMQKNGEITEDDLKYGEKEMQDITDKFVKEADSVAAEKEKEIMAI